MKIVHIGTNTTGGAGIGMMQLHQTLLSRGVDSRVVCISPRDEDVNDPRVSVVSSPDEQDELCDKFESVVMDLRRKYRCPASNPFSKIRLDRHPFVVDADIVHLHWASGILDTRTFFENVGKSVVWTLRDENPLMGLYHVPCDKPSCPLPEEREMDEYALGVKREKIGKCPDLTFVALNTRLKTVIESSAVGRGREVFVIPNAINPETYARRQRKETRDRLGIAPDEIMLLFATQFLGARYKGLAELFDSIQYLERRPKKLAIVCVGNGRPPEGAPDGVRIITPGFTRSTEELSAYYSAADIFITPSFSETFGKTTVEALACGTPVVSFPNNGARDIVVDGVDGALTESYTAPALARAIGRVLLGKFDPGVLRERVAKRFSVDSVVCQHMELYRKVLDVPVQIRRAVALQPCPDAEPIKCAKNPKLSIITICFNNADGLRMTLQSTLREQYSYSDLEQIVVDGGSQDDTAQVLAEYKDRLGWCCSEPDKGIYDAMNKGAAHAHGEYLLFLNSGDVLLPDMLKEVMSTPFTEDLVYSDIYFRTGNKLSKSISPSLAEMTPGWFLFNSLPHQATFIRRDLHNRIGGYDSTMKISAAPKFIFKALFELHCTYRKLDFIFSIFDRSGISSQPRMLRPKLNEWMDFLSPYYGKRVAGIAMRWLTVSKAVDWSIYEYLRWHPQDCELIKNQIKGIIAGLRAHEAAEAKRMPSLHDSSQRNQGDVSLKRQVNLLSREVSALKRSAAYRVGMFVTWPARRAYRMLKCYRENGFKYTLRRLILGKRFGMSSSLR